MHIIKLCISFRSNFCSTADSLHLTISSNATRSFRPMTALSMYLISDIHVTFTKMYNKDVTLSKYACNVLDDMNYYDGPHDRLSYLEGLVIVHSMTVEDVRNIARVGSHEVTLKTDMSDYLSVWQPGSNTYREELAVVARPRTGEDYGNMYICMGTEGFYQAMLIAELEQAFWVMTILEIE